MFRLHGRPLSTFPYVIVRPTCTLCSCEGSYWLARLADKYGAQIAMPELLARLAGDCKYWGRQRHPGIRGCGAYLKDLASAPRRPDLPPSARRLKVVR